jgi:phospholipid/cholesterol/gamma-HCH transport system ATP-binding protein
VKPVAVLGARALGVAEGFGGLTQLTLRTFRVALERQIPWREMLRALDDVGTRSTSIVTLTALFTGLVLALQTGVGLKRFGSTQYVGYIVSLAIVRELGPVLTALIVGGRVAGGMAAELGSMKVTEQVDAIRAMGADPIRKLVLPRVVACALAFPMLAILADVLGILGGLVIAMAQFKLPGWYFLQTVLLSVEAGDVMSGLAKTLFFGFAIAVVSCHEGLRASGGTVGVGLALSDEAVHSPMTTSEIQLEQVHKSFEGHEVLRGLDLEVRRGETLSILGASGTGKSVMLKLMIGLLGSDSGQVRFRGRDVTRLSEREWIPVRRHFGVVFQGAALFDSLSVLENVAYSLREHTNISELAIRQIVAEKLRLVGLEGIEGKFPAELSGGMRKRVGVARALALDPEVLLYDEPTTGLDPANSRRVGELIVGLQQRLNVTAIVVTHDLPLSFSISHRVGLLHEGRIVQLDTPSQIRQRPAPPMQEFLEGASLGAP